MRLDQIRDLKDDRIESLIEISSLSEVLDFLYQAYKEDPKRMKHIVNSIPIKAWKKLLKDSDPTDYRLFFRAMVLDFRIISICYLLFEMEVFELKIRDVDEFKWMFEVLDVMKKINRDFVLVFDKKWDRVLFEKAPSHVVEFALEDILAMDISFFKELINNLGTNFFVSRFADLDMTDIYDLLKLLKDKKFLHKVIDDGFGIIDDKLEILLRKTKKSGEIQKILDFLYSYSRKWSFLNKHDYDLESATKIVLFHIRNNIPCPELLNSIREKIKKYFDFDEYKGSIKDKLNLLSKGYKSIKTDFYKRSIFHFYCIFMNKELIRLGKSAGSSLKPTSSLFIRMDIEAEIEDFYENQNMARSEAFDLMSKEEQSDKYEIFDEMKEYEDEYNNIIIDELRGFEGKRKDDLKNLKKKYSESKIKDKMIILADIVPYLMFEDKTTNFVERALQELTREIL